MLERTEWIKKMDTLGTSGIPFFCLIDFDGGGVVHPIDTLPKSIQFDFHQNFDGWPAPTIPFSFSKMPFAEYEKAFNLVQQAINHGDSYLLNLTFETPFHTEASLADIYEQVRAPYKILYYPYFVCFSPETFVQIEKEQIATFPMKGTQKITDEKDFSLLQNDKERYEQFTITDLMRNDLSQVANKVRVSAFQETMHFKVGQDTLIQTFTRIEGELDEKMQNRFGTILGKMLPAGSITGAPKVRTVDWIRRVESCNRGFYTGIAGYFDGYTFDSAVLIRFIEKREGKLFYKSGGGITSQSQARNEYEEIYQKIYLP